MPRMWSVLVNMNSFHVSPLAFALAPQSQSSPCGWRGWAGGSEGGPAWGGVLLETLLGSHCGESGTVGAHWVSMLEWRVGASPAWGRPHVCLLAPVDRVEGGCISVDRRRGRQNPTEERVGPQVNPEGRVPGILQLGVGPWGLSGLCLCQLAALPVRGPSAGGAWSNSLGGLAGPGWGPWETQGPTARVTRVLGSESHSPQRPGLCRVEGGAWGAGARGRR